MGEESSQSRRSRETDDNWQNDERRDDFWENFDYPTTTRDGQRELIVKMNQRDKWQSTNDERRDERKVERVKLKDKRKAGKAERVTGLGKRELGLICKKILKI